MGIVDAHAVQLGMYRDEHCGLRGVCNIEVLRCMYDTGT